MSQAETMKRRKYASCPSRFVYTPQTREMICKVYKFMKKEAVVKFAENLTDARWRTSRATDISESTVTRMLKEMRALEQDEKSVEDSSAPLAKKTKVEPEKIDLSGYNTGLIRKALTEYLTGALSAKKSLTFEDLHKFLVDRVDFEISITDLKKHLCKIGYKWMRTGKRCKVLIESNTVQLSRLRYLKQVKAYRNAGRPIVYIGETVVRTNDVEKDCVTGLKPKLEEGEPITIIHAGSEKGFIPNAAMTLKADIKTGDSHDNTKFESDYHNWVQLQLIPNLPKDAVVVMDDIYAYKNAEISDKAPKPYSKKGELMAWLTANNINFPPLNTNAELYNLVKKNINAKKNTNESQRIKVDDLIESHGFTVQRLPPHHPELNAIENIWYLVKTYVSFNNVEQTYESVKDLIFESFEENNSDVWARTCRSVEEIEEWSSLNITLKLTYRAKRARVSASASRKMLLYILCIRLSVCSPLQVVFLNQSG